jgi:hypothetical protein
MRLVSGWNVSKSSGIFEKSSIDGSTHLFTIENMGLITKLFWAALFVGFTFSFVVLFEHGSKDFLKDFAKNAKIEYASFQEFTAPSKAKSTDGNK